MVQPIIKSNVNSWKVGFFQKYIVGGIASKVVINEEYNNILIIDSLMSIFLLMISSTAKPKEDKIKIKEAGLKSAACGLKVMAIPINPTIVTTHLCQIIFSVKKNGASIKTNSGTAKLSTVAVVTHTTLKPKIHEVILTNNRTPRIK